MSTTLQTVIDRITLDYLNRTDFNSAAIRAVQAAIRYYERQRWPWNQAVNTSSSVAGVSTLAVPSDFLVLDLLEVTFQSVTYALAERPFADIRQMNAAPGSSNVPSYYAQRGLQFEFAPIPDAVYPITLHYIRQLPKLTSSDMTSTNDWLSAAEDVIVYHATKLLWSNTLRNIDEATKFAQLETGAVKSLVSYRDQNVAGKIRATPL